MERRLPAATGWGLRAAYEVWPPLPSRRYGWPARRGGIVVVMCVERWLGGRYHGSMCMMSSRRGYVVCSEVVVVSCNSLISPGARRVQK